jgi:hypothetical protein
MQELLLSVDEAAHEKRTNISTGQLSCHGGDDP